MESNRKWTQRLWLNPPMRYKLGAGRGTWRYAMLVVLVVVVGVLILVDTNYLDKAWAYAVVPIAIVAAALSLVLTIFKAAAEEKRT